MAERLGNEHVGIAGVCEDRPAEHRLWRPFDERPAEISRAHETAFDSPYVGQVRALRVAGDAVSDWPAILIHRALRGFGELVVAELASTRHDRHVGEQGPGR